MRVPRDGAVRRVRAEADPLVARCAEDAVRLELGDVRVRAEVVDALLFRALRATAFGGRAGEVVLMVVVGRAGAVWSEGIAAAALVPRRFGVC